MTALEGILIEAESLNLSAIGICAPDQLDAAKAHFNTFIKAKQYGDMQWMEEKADRRTDPKTLWPEVKSIIMLGLNYGPEHNPLHGDNPSTSGNISVYARGKDYHDIFKKRIKHLARYIHQKHNSDVKVFVDTAPVMEKPLAALAGLGWQGKHTNLVSQEFGSWLFLGAIFTTLELAPNTPHQNQCGTCQSCIDICPTKAITAPYKLDPRLCISYLTIEHKGHIDAPLRALMGNHIYGCDDCLAVCPWNKFAKPTLEPAFEGKPELDQPPLSTLLKLDDAAFREFFKGTPIKRTGRDRFLRNCLIASGNSGERNLCKNIIPHLSDPNPIVRVAAIWALKQLATALFEKERVSKKPHEQDPEVLHEWG